MKDSETYKQYAIGYRAGLQAAADWIDKRVKVKKPVSGQALLQSKKLQLKAEGDQE